MSIQKRLVSAALCLCVLWGLLPAAAWAVTPGSTQQNEKIYGKSIVAWKDGAVSFNINGIDGGKTYQTTYRNLGYKTTVSVDGAAKQINPPQLLAAGLRLDVDLQKYAENYIMVQYTLTNNGAEAHKIRIGGHADVMIDKNDRAPIYAETKGGSTLNMVGSPKNSYAFKLMAPSCDTLWYGSFYDEYRDCFTDKEDRGPNNKFTGDSALGYSWLTTVAPGEVWTRCILLGVGSLNEMSAASPSVPAPQVLMPDPAILLSTNEIYLTEGAALPEWKSYIASFTGEVTTSGTPGSTKTPGTYTVTYTAKSGTKTARAALKVHILPKPAALSRTTVSGTGSFTLSATMERTGGLTWQETGFVYGLLAKPSLAQSEGTVKTSRPVNSENGKLTATVAKSALVAGLPYYARAYAKAADGTVLYGESSASFGVNAPKNGVISVQNNGGNTFTFTRTGGTDGRQTVYYRTVNGSAVGGTHFTHRCGELTFSAGSSASQSISVAESGANTPSSSATAYSNADRTYQMEIYRVEGGATIGTARATRKLTNGSDYTVDRSVYSEKERAVTVNDSNKWVADHSGKGDWKIYFRNDRDKNTNQINFNVQRTLAASDKEKFYLEKTAQGMLYRSYFTFQEEEDGWQLVWAGNHKPDSYGPFEAREKYIEANTTAFGKAYYTATWETNGKNPDMNFPSMAGSGVKLHKSVTAGNAGNKMRKVEFDNKAYLLFDIDDTAHIWFSAAGSGKDIWYMKSYRDYLKVYDTVEPQLVDMTPMAGGKYLPGDSVTVALVFKEIVDKTNSSLSSSSQITTNWGVFRYAGGADTNVLYFTGTVPENPPDYIRLTSLNCASQIKDMSADTGTVSGYSTTPSQNVTVGTVTAPTVTVGTITNTHGALSSTVTATGAVKLEYAWSTSRTLPTSGWTTAGSSSSAAVKTARSAGTYYLHARATNRDGLVKTASRSVTVSSSGSNAVSSNAYLQVTAADSTWARQQTITVSRLPTDANVTVKPPSGASTVHGSGNVSFSYTAKTNGLYTFTMKVNGETITRQAVISKIDTTAPAITIHDLPGSRYAERITLTFSVADGGSGVNSVTAKWGSTAASVTKNSDGTYSVLCPNTTGTHQLTVTATDKVGNSAVKSSKSYTVDLRAPTLTVTRVSQGATGAIYSYQVTANGNTGIVLHLPDGTETTALNGRFTMKEPGTYRVTLSDAAGHFVSSDLTVANTVDGTAPDVRLYAAAEPASSLPVEVSVLETGSTPTLRLNGTALAASAGEGSGLYTSRFTVTKGGVYTVAAVDGAGNRGQAALTAYALVDRAARRIAAAEPDGTYGNLPLPASEKTGHSFAGWYTAETGGTKAEAAGQVDAGYTLYARWTANTYTLTFNANGGSPNPGNTTVTYGETYGTLPVPTRPGYAFAGWYTAASGGTQVKATTPVTEAKDHTLYARWEAVSVTVTWGELAFTYEDGTWNPRTHTYVGGGWRADGSAAVTVENRGAAAVTVTLDYTAADAAIAGSFAYSGGGAVTGPVTLAPFEKKQFRLDLSGKPSGPLEKGKIGTVTVRLGGGT